MTYEMTMPLLRNYTVYSRKEIWCNFWLQHYVTVTRPLAALLPLGIMLFGSGLRKENKYIRFESCLLLSLCYSLL
jgi:hypothetical protein